MFADIYHPVKPSFREYAVVFHDEMEIKDKNGNQPHDPDTGLPQSTMAISYRSEPMRHRHLHMDHDNGHSESQRQDEEAVQGEDISMNSWPYGDPAPQILRAYVGDPSKIRLINGGIKETHVFHLHNHQWRLEPNDPKSTIIDSISISPQTHYTLDILYGAGSLNGMIGDAIWHCHLYPHFNEGMWSLWRVFDKLEDGKGKYPDGTTIAALMPLKDRLPPPPKDPMHPGYPNFVNGQFGERPLQPPLGVLKKNGDIKIYPTDLEKANFVPNFAAGALYTETCPCQCSSPDVKIFEMALVQANVVYNSHGWHDPQGRFFVLKETIAKYGTLENYIKKIECGAIQSEPLVIRANAGDCIEIRLTNLLPEFIESSAFQLKTLTDIVGYHIHLVKFDTIVSDGGANGWNNIAGARKYETLIERFYANEELHTVFFHDHLSANTHQQHGVFGGLIIEPTGSSYFDPFTGEELRSGTKAVIRRADGTEFREFLLFVHDFALLFDKDNEPLNPPQVPGSPDDPGVMGINYRCEPLRERLSQGVDPAYVFLSDHGDPATPLLETYAGDPMVIRLLDGAHEEQHSFNIAGMQWKKEITDPVSPIVQSQALGISEAFNFKIDQYYAAGDYMYYFGGIDDIWLGLWGIIRAYDEANKRLRPICRGHQPPQPKPLTPPEGSAIRKYEIAAIQKDIKYNNYGDHDPDGLLFVPLSDANDIKKDKKHSLPLILRANAGDWIEVTLHNLLEQPVQYFDYPSVPVDKEHTPSMRVSICPQFLQYDITSSYGVNVGKNPIEQTVAPGESKKYLWHADKEYGSCIINSFGDVRNHRYHGLFGAIIIEPPNSKYYSENNKKMDCDSEQAVITAPGIQSFREFVLFIQNGVRLLDKEGKLIKTTEAHTGDGGHGAPDHEDTGEKGYNYRSERFFNRLQKNKDISKIFSSKVHGDPATPLFKAFPGERVILRVLMPADKPRNVGFILHGHNWRVQPNDPFTDIRSVQSTISIGNVFNIELENGASQIPGDYLYRSGTIKWDIESGMWGIFRVVKRTIGDCIKNFFHKILD